MPSGRDLGKCVSWGSLRTGGKAEIDGHRMSIRSGGSGGRAETESDSSLCCVGDLQQRSDWAAEIAGPNLRRLVTR